MSILQEYEEIRAILGHEKYDMISKYLDKVSPPEKYEEYSRELSEYNKASYEQFASKDRELKQKYGIILLSDVLYKVDEWNKYDKWFHEEYKKRKVEILSAWKSDFGDIRYNAILYQNNKPIANIIGNCESLAWEEELNNLPKFKDLAYCDFENLTKLPKISKCSKLLQEIYDTVCKSDCSMCYISDDDWKDGYADRYKDNDIERLKQEVKKYKLDKVITLDENNYKILGYGNLELSFNDDRKIVKSKDMER